MSLATIFGKYLVLWVNEAKKKLETWVTTAVEVDTVYSSFPSLSLSHFFLSNIFVNILLVVGEDVIRSTAFYKCG